MRNDFPGSSLRDLARLRDCRRKRCSSYDQTGANKDFVVIPAREDRVLCGIHGSGCINHIWMTTECNEPNYLRRILLRMYWDNETSPSVEVPFGDFFGIGHGLRKNYWSLPLSMSPQDGRGFNCFFPMPFNDAARILVSNEMEDADLVFYYYIDYEEYPSLDPGLARFHAQWRREIRQGIDETGMTNEEFEFEGINLTGEDNYVILEAEGRGQYVGCNLNVHNLRITDEWNWYGEGDDMIFIDGEPFPPSLHGTGTEDYFNMAYCPEQEYLSPYHGLIYPGGPNWSGKITLYRFHIEDPVVFQKSIRVTIEHGHANRRSDDYSSTAYWYQAEPHKALPPILPVKDRLPLPD